MLVSTDEGVRGCASGDALPDAALLERLVVGLDPFRTEVVRELCETVDFHGGRPWTLEVAVWDVVGRALGEPLWRLLGGRSESLVAYASNAERLPAPERAARCVDTARRGRACRQTALPRRRLAPGCGGGGGGARRGRARHADHGRRESGLADGGRPDPAVGRRHGACSAPVRSSRSRSSGSRSRCAPTTSPATPRFGRGRRCAWRPVRWCATRTQARDLVVRGGVDVIQPDVVLVGGDRRGAPDRRAGRSARPHVVAAHLVERLRPGREPARCARLFDLRLRRGAVRPAHVAGGRGATGCCRRRSRSRPTAPSARRRGRAWASSPTWTPSSTTGSHEHRADRDPARRCSSARASRVRVERLLLAPAARRRGAGARRRRRRVPLRPASRPGPPRRPALADRARTRGRGRRGGRRRAGHPRAPGRPRGVLLRAAVRGLHACAWPASRTCAGRRPELAARRPDGRHLAPRAARRRPDQALPARVVLRRALRGPGRRGRPAHRRPAAVAGGAGRLQRRHRRGRGAKRRPGRGRRVRVRDRLRRGGAAGRDRREAGRAPAGSWRSTATRPSWRSPRARGATDVVEAGRRRPGRPRRARAATASTTPFEVDRPGRHDPAGLGRAAAGRSGDGGRDRARRSRGVAPGARPLEREDAAGLFLRLGERRRASCPSSSSWRPPARSTWRRWSRTSPTSTASRRRSSASAAARAPAPW